MRFFLFFETTYYLPYRKNRTQDSRDSKPGSRVWTWNLDSGPRLEPRIQEMNPELKNELFLLQETIYEKRINQENQIKS